MTTAIETQLFDIVYAKLLSKNIMPVYARSMAALLIEISKESGVSTDDLLKNVTPSGIKFDVNIYRALNSVRSNSSQIGFFDISNISQTISSQIPDLNAAKNHYVGGGHINNFISIERMS